MLASDMSLKILGIFVLLSAISLADTVNISPTSLDFGAQPLGTTTSQNLTLANPTKKQLNISSISVSGDFASPSNTCGGSLFPGEQCTITVTFRPTALGTRSAILSVNDDANNTPQKVKLTGSGLPAVLQYFTILSFGNNLKRGQTSQLTAIGQYTDGSRQDLTVAATWSSNAPAVATVSPSGLVTPTGPGTVII